MPNACNIASRGSRPRSSREWCAYFEANAHKAYSVPRDAELILSPEERAAVTASIQKFQLGESGTGKHILRIAERYATGSGDREYPLALRRFFEEEHRHARDLGRVLDCLGIPRIHTHWTDGVFRRLRHCAGLEAAISILLTPELIAKIYYAALHNGTAAPILRKLCRQILKDEAMHIRFQTERLAILRRGQARWRVHLSQFSQHVFFIGTCAAFWVTHRQAMRAGGFSWCRFLRRAGNEWRAAARMMDPARYGFHGRELDDSSVSREQSLAVYKV